MIFLVVWLFSFFVLPLCAFYVLVDTVISCNGMNKVFCAAMIRNKFILFNLG